MKIGYQGFTFSIPMMGIIQIEEFVLRAELNDHAHVYFKLLVEEEEAISSVHRLLDGAEIQIEEAEKMLFRGKVLTASAKKEKGLYVVTIEAVSYTYEWSLEEVSQSFMDQEDTYEKVIEKVLSNYEEAQAIDCASEGAKMPGFLLQYEEDDWTFLKRLASHFETFLVPEFTQGYGRVYFGIPEIKNGVQLKENEYQISKNMDAFYRFSYKEHFQPQETVRWQIQSEKRLVLGEEVFLHDVRAIITSVQYYLEKGEILRRYEAGRKKGILCAYQTNPRIGGMSIPAIVKERKGNQIRVHFDIDKSYEARPKNTFFTYAIESSCFYCMPEEESLVHIYFPTPYEQEAIAVHAMRMENYQGPAKISQPAAGTGGQHAQNPDYKSFSNVNGAELLLTPEAISMAAEEAKSTVVFLSGEGTATVNGKTITVEAETDLCLGEGEADETGAITPTKEIVLRGGEGVLISAKKEENSGITLKEEVKIRSTFLKLEGSDFSIPSPCADEIRESVTKEDEANREMINSQVKDALVQKKKEATKKVWSGLVKLGTIIAATVAVVVTGGAATPLFIAAGVNAAFGVADVVEGLHGTYQATHGDLSQSFNFLRDTVFGGDQFLYDLGKGISDIVFGIVSGKSLGKVFDLCGSSAKVKTVLQIGSNVLPQVIEEFMTEGKVNWGNLAFNFFLGTVQGQLTSRFSQILSGKIGRYFDSPIMKHAINIVTGTSLDVGTDYIMSLIYGQEFNLGESLIKNSVSNTLSEMIGEPVESSSGAYYTEVTDLKLEDLGGTFALERRYFSTVTHSGVMGKGWSFSYDSVLRRAKEDGSEIYVDTVTGQQLLFRREGENWQIVSKGCSWFFLSYEEEQKRWCLANRKDHTNCFYNERGQLERIEDKNEEATRFFYEGKRLSQIVTPLGKRIWVTWNEQKIASFRDESGRVVTYQYEGELLTAVIHVNEGVMEYGYDGNGYLNQIIDQNGEKFLRNEYDREGRIKKQYLSNGEYYTMSYDLSKKKTTVYYSGLDREDVVSYNAERLPIQIKHGDGTKEAYEYEEGYRTKKKDKRGNETKWCYDAFGRMRAEHFADGYEKYYEYDEQDDLVKEWDNEQEALWYEYDAHHNKIKEIQQVREGKVRERRYEYDRRGRLRKSTNALGVSTIYQYHPNEGAPYYVKNGKGEETYYEYDMLGRRVAVKNAYGRVEYGYNQKNLVTSYKDGEGNESHKLYDRLDNLIVYYPPKAWKEKSKGWHYRYDSLDRRIETITPLEEHYRTYRDGEGYIQKEIHPNAYERGAKEEIGVSYEHDKGHHRIRIYSPEGGIERRFYDEEGNLIKQVLPEQYEKEKDDGEGYTYCYDVRNRLTAVYAPDGTKEKEYFYDGTGRVVKEISGGSREKRYQYDGLGHVIEERESLRREGETVWYRGKENVYDAEGNLVIERYGTKEIREEEPITEYEEIRYFYDENGHVERIEDGYGAYEKYAYDCLGNRIYEERLIEEGIVQKIRYRYDKAGRCIEKKEYQMGNGTSAPAITRYGYDENGNVIKVITPNGKEKRYAYDACNRLLEERMIDKPNGIDRVVSYSYDKAGNVIEREVGGKREARASYQKENYTYNYEDQAVEKINACGGRYAYFYDKNQQVIEVREPEQEQGMRYRYDNRGNVVEVRDALGIRREERSYNEQNELIRQRDAYGKEVGYRYREDGVLLGVETERSKREGRERQAYEYNARGQLIGLKDGNGNQTEYKRDGWGRIGTIKKADHSEEHYEYYPSGKLKRRVDAKGNEVRYHYNSQGKLRKRIDESGGEEEYFYDGEGNVILKIDRNGSRIERSYTVDGNVVWQRARKVTGEESTTKYTYNERGEVETASKGGYCYRYLYTKGGKLKEKRKGGRLLFGCGYNARGQISCLTDETGKRSEYLYDKLGRLERIRLEEGKEIRYTYDKKDRIQVIWYPNGVTSEYGYDEEGNLEKLETKQGEAVWLSLRYTYDGEGNRLKRRGKQRGSNGLEEVETSYAYDEKNQLCEEKTRENTIVYQYDIVGNRTERRSREGEEKYEYNERNQLISFEKGKEKRRFTYDKEGSIIKEERREGEREYEYDAEKKLVRLKREDGREERYGYDGEGKRIDQKGRGRNRRYCYYGQKLLWEEEEGGERKRSYVLGYGIEGVEEEGKRYYYQKDERESTKYISDDEGELRNRYEYDGYGRLEEKEEELAPIFLYTGQEYDEDLEGYWLGERIYREDYGRFLKEDEYEGDGLNLYAYCRNNPIVYYDPSGYMGQPNGTENGKHGEGEKETKELSAKDFPNGFPKPIISDRDTYHRFLEQKIGIKLGNNDIVLGVAEAGYQYFGIRKKNTKNILGKHIYSLNEQGYRNEQGDKYDYRISDIDKLYTISVGKIYFMVDGMQPNEKLTEYLANKKYRNLDNKDGLRVTEKELVAVLMRESNFKKTTFCFKGDPIPFSVVKEVLNLPVEYE